MSTPIPVSSMDRFDGQTEPELLILIDDKYHTKDPWMKIAIVTRIQAMRDHLSNVDATLETDTIQHESTVDDKIENKTLETTTLSSTFPSITFPPPFIFTKTMDTSTS
jgi:hypothetical protein